MVTKPSWWEGGWRPEEEVKWVEVGSDWSRNTVGGGRGGVSGGRVWVEGRRGV